MLKSKFIKRDEKIPRGNQKPKVKIKRWTIPIPKKKANDESFPVSVKIRRM